MLANKRLLGSQSSDLSSIWKQILAENLVKFLDWRYLLPQDLLDDPEQANEDI